MFPKTECTRTLTCTYEFTSVSAWILHGWLEERSLIPCLHHRGRGPHPLSSIPSHKRGLQGGSKRPYSSSALLVAYSFGSPHVIPQNKKNLFLSFFLSLFPFLPHRHSKTTVPLNTHLQSHGITEPVLTVL